jgi:hypothetical protein
MSWGLMQLMGEVAREIGIRPDRIFRNSAIRRLGLLFWGCKKCEVL